MKNGLMLTTFIDDFISADETEPVALIIAGSDAWSVEKAAQLIKTAPRLYTALCSASEHLANVDPSWSENDEIEQAIAAACWAVAKTKQSPSVGGKAE